MIWRHEFNAAQADMRDIVHHHTEMAHDHKHWPFTRDELQAHLRRNTPQSVTLSSPSRFRRWVHWPW